MDPLFEMTRLTSAYVEATTDERQLIDQSSYHDEEEFFSAAVSQADEEELLDEEEEDDDAGAEANAAVENSTHSSFASATASPPVPPAGVGASMQPPPARSVKEKKTIWQQCSSIWNASLDNLGKLSAVAFGSAGLWYMYQTDKMSKWNTGKADYDYCVEREKPNVSQDPHCLAVLASNLDPPPYVIRSTSWITSEPRDVLSSSWIGTELLYSMLALGFLALLLRFYHRHLRSERDQTIKNELLTSIESQNSAGQYDYLQAVDLESDDIASIESANNSSLRLRHRGNMETAHSEPHDSESTKFTDNYPLPLQRGIFENAMAEVVETLIKDPFIQELCDIAVIRLDQSRFERNVSRLLRQFAIDLKIDAKTLMGKAVGTFIQHQRRRIAVTLCEKVAKLCNPISQNRTLDQQLKLEGTLAHTQKQVRSQRSKTLQYVHCIYIGEKFVSRYSDHGDAGPVQQPHHVEAIRSCFTSTQAFWNLRDSFRNSFLRHAWAIYQEGIRQIICHNNPKMITAGPEAEDRENGS